MKQPGVKNSAITMFWRAFIVCLLAALAAVATNTEAAAATGQSSLKRPNILWLIAEDFGPHLGCYGENGVRTPHLDTLAARGVRYTRFYTTAPVCSASRSAFMTGMYQTAINAHNHRSHRDDGFVLPEGVRVLSDWMRDAGYFTANIRELPESCGFKGTGKTDWNFTYYGKPFDSESWADLKGRQPFFAQVNFKETHRRFNAPAHADPSKVRLPPYLPDHPVARADWAAYLDSATELDRKVGLILAQLERDGLTDNTVVVFFGDNGQAHVRGKQWCYESGLRVPMIISWPENFSAPRRFKSRTVDDRLLMSIDLAPAMLRIAGAKIPEKMQGRDFLASRSGASRKYVFGARDRCDETVFRFRTVRDARYRYIRNFTPDRPFLQANEYMEKSYPAWNLLKELNAGGRLTEAQKKLCAPTMPAEELYDLDNDPHEINNLADSPAHSRTLRRMRGALDEWMIQTRDKGAALEPADVAARCGLTRPESRNPNASAVIE